MEKSKLSPKKIKIIAFIFCILFMALAGFFVSYALDKYEKKKKNFEAKKAKLIKLKNDSWHLKELIAYYKKEREDFEKILFNKRDIPSFLKGVSRFGQDAEVNILSMKTNKFKEVKMVDTESLSPLARKKFAQGSKENKTTKNKEEGPFLMSLPIDIRISGEFNSLVKFLFFLEQYRQLLTIADLEIERGKYPILQCSFTLKLYSLETTKEMARK